MSGKSNSICDQETFEALMKHKKYEDSLRGFGANVITPKNYYIFSGLNNLHEHTLELKDLFDVRIENCDLEEKDSIYIKKGVDNALVENSTIKNRLLLTASDLKTITLKDSYIETLELNYMKNIYQISLYNTIINELKFTRCMVDGGILMNEGCAINNLIVYRTFINNTNRHFYNNMYPNEINSAYDIIIDDELLDVVKNDINFKYSYIIEDPDDEICTFTINNNNNSKNKNNNITKGE